MFNRSKATTGGKRLRATGGVPGMAEVLLLAAALFMILVPPYLNDVMARARSDASKRAMAVETAATTSTSCEIRSARLEPEKTN